MSEASVGTRTARAAVWAFVQTAGARVVTLAGLTVLARILAPAEFGLLAFAMVYITYAETIGDLGTGMALVYWPDRREDAAQITFLVNLATGLFWFAVSLLLAPYIAEFFNSPDGANIVRALSLTFILRYLGNTHDALAQKDLAFRARTFPEIGLTVVKAAISIVLAWLGFGAWSLVWGQLGGIFAQTIFRWMIVPWRPSLRIPWDLLRPMLVYGRGIVAVNVISAVMYYIDLAVVGREYSPTILGLYQMASKVPEATVVVILWVVSKVLFPLFAKLHAAGEELREPYLVATSYVAALTLPAGVGLFFVARPLVLVFFGAQWIGAAPMLQAFAIYVTMRSIDFHAGDVLKAIGRATLLAWLNAVKAVLIVAGVLVGARISAVAVAGSLAIVYAIGMAATLVAVARILRVGIPRIALAFLPATKACIAMSLALAAWQRWSPHVTPVAELAIEIAIGAAAYALVMLTSERELVAAARDSLRGGRTQLAASSVIPNPRPGGAEHGEGSAAELQGSRIRSAARVSG